jgi:hypothetical protein
MSHRDDAGLASMRGTRRFAYGVFVAALLACLCASTASASVVGRLSWQRPVLVDPSAKLTTIACPSASMCVAADRSGNVITSTDPASGAAAWEVAHVDSNEGCGTEACSFEAISCPSASFCAAVDNAGYVFTSTDPTAGATGWSSVKISAPNTITALSCPSISLCVAVDYHGNAITSTSPTAGAGTWHTTTIDSGPCTAAVCHSIDKGPPERQLDAISCPSVSLCVAGDWDGDVVTSTDPTGGGSAWNVAYVDSSLESGLTGLDPQTAIAGISCPSVSLCVANDGVGNVLTSQDPTGGASTWSLRRATPRILAAPEPRSLYSLGCPSVSFCAGLQSASNTLLSSSEAALTYEPLGSTEWTRVVIDRVGSPSAIACPTSSLCVAVDNAGNVVVGRMQPPPTRAQIQAALRVEITPRGRTSLIGALLRHRGFSLAFNPPTPGGVRIRWLLLPAGMRSPLSRARALLIARGQRNFPETESAPIMLRLTKAGVAMLRRRNHVQLTTEAIFTPLGSHPVTATERFTLRR